MDVNLENLADVGEVAQLVGLSNLRGVSVYRRRYPDFPQPVLQKGACTLWLRSEVAAWVEEHPRRQRSGGA